jgi:hypothetical protein
MSASGQTKPRPQTNHSCQPPRGFAIGLLWICPDCWSEFIYRPVYAWELQRVVNLWVRFWEPKYNRWVPMQNRPKWARRPLTTKEMDR